MQTQHREMAGWLHSTTRVDRATGPDMQLARTLQQDSVNHVVVTSVGLHVNGGAGGGSYTQKRTIHAMVYLCIHSR